MIPENTQVTIVMDKGSQEIRPDGTKRMLHAGKTYKTIPHKLARMLVGSNKAHYPTKPDPREDNSPSPPPGSDTPPEP